MSTPERKVAERVIAELMERKGFEHWWEDIEPDIQSEIVGIIAEVIDWHSLAIINLDIDNRNNQ